MKLTLTEKDIKRAIAEYYGDELTKCIPEEVVTLDRTYGETCAEIDFDKAEEIVKAITAQIDAQLTEAFEPPTPKAASPEKSDIIRDDPILFSGKRLSDGAGDNDKF